MKRMNGLAMATLLGGLTLAAFSGFAAAQDRDAPREHEREDQRGQPPQRDPNTTPERDIEKPKMPDTSSTAPKPETSPSAGEKTPVVNERFGGRMSPKAAQKKLLLEEAKYRDQRARIARLRELATEQGNEERLAALDKLEAKMTELHERKVAAARSAMGDQEFDKLNKEIEKGRGRGRGAEGGVRGNGAAGEREKGRSDAENKKPDDAGKERRKPQDSARPNQTNPSNENRNSNAGGKGKDKP